MKGYCSSCEKDVDTVNHNGRGAKCVDCFTPVSELVPNPPKKKAPATKKAASK